MPFEEAGNSIVPPHEDHRHIIPINQRPITGRKPEGGETTETELVAGRVGDADRRVVADQGGVGIVTGKQVGPGTDVARLKDLPDLPQKRLVDLVAIVLEDPPFGPVAVDEIAPKTHIVVELCRR